MQTIPLRDAWIRSSGCTAAAPPTTRDRSSRCSSAVDALRATGIKPTVNLKFFFDGEEEAGSAHVRAILEREKDLLRADVWLFADGPVHQSRRMQVVFGARGDMGLEMTVYGPARALHSGHYGNWAPNPAARADRRASPRCGRATAGS